MTPMFKNWAEVEAVFAEAFDVPPAIADTHPKGGDGEAAPSLMSGGGADRQSPKHSPTTKRG